MCYIKYSIVLLLSWCSPCPLAFTARVVGCKWLSTVCWNAVTAFAIFHKLTQITGENDCYSGLVCRCSDLMYIIVCLVVFSLVPVLVSLNFATVKNVQDWGTSSHPHVAGWSGEFCINTFVRFIRLVFIYTVFTCTGLIQMRYSSS